MAAKFTPEIVSRWLVAVRSCELQVVRCVVQSAPMDQYRVVAEDGKEFGPTDLTGLLQWVKEGRVLKNTRIRKNDGAAIAAEFLPELSEALQPKPVGPGAPPIAT